MVRFKWPTWAFSRLEDFSLVFGRGKSALHFQLCLFGSFVCPSFGGSVDVMTLHNCGPDRLCFSKWPFQHPGSSLCSLMNDLSFFFSWLAELSPCSGDELSGSSMCLSFWVIRVSVFLGHPCVCFSDSSSSSQAFHLEASLSQISSFSRLMEPLDFHPLWKTSSPA